MCGRFTLIVEEQELRAALGPVDWAMEYRPRYNAAPGQAVPLLVRRGASRRLVAMHWGLTPAWSTDGRGSWINARMESIADRPAFRDAFRLRRGVVPADGFYEWAGVGKQRRPFHVRPAAGGIVGFAAVWEAEPGRGMAILTREAVPALRDLHNRMPVTLSGREQWDAWLDPSLSEEELLALVRDVAVPAWEMRPVSLLVNAPVNDEPACLEPASDGGDPPAAPAAGGAQLSLFG